MFTTPGRVGGNRSKNPGGMNNTRRSRRRPPFTKQAVQMGLPGQALFFRY